MLLTTAMVYRSLFQLSFNGDVASEAGNALGTRVRLLHESNRLR